MLPDEPVQPPAWPFPTKIAFRFFALYFFLYVLVTQMLGSLLGGVAGFLGFIEKPFILLTEWVGTRVFHVIAKSHPTGSGDTMFAWVETFCLLVIAIAGCLLWSILDHRRQRYARLYHWFRVFLRFALGATMISYGFVKAFPLQMPAPQLTRLLEPYGNFSPMGVLWYSIGASFPYERFVGMVEVIGGGLLFFPPTQLAGALVCMAATIQVFALNMTYDVPVKLFSFHLVLMSAVLIAPFVRHLCDVVLTGRARSRWAAIAQVLFGLYLLAMNCFSASHGWASRGPGAPKPPLYGIWTIDKMWIDGVERAPLLTDYDRYRRFIVQSASTVVFWRMDDTPQMYPAKIQADQKLIKLTAGTTELGALKYEQPTPDQLIIQGRLGSSEVRMITTRLDHTKFFLLTRGFNWVQEYPVNR